MDRKVHETSGSVGISESLFKIKIEHCSNCCTVT
jgi:hypothetical protein